MFSGVEWQGLDGTNLRFSSMHSVNLSFAAQDW
jgi:hypothetical protein